MTAWYIYEAFSAGLAAFKPTKYATSILMRSFFSETSQPLSTPATSISCRIAQLTCRKYKNSVSIDKTEPWHPRIRHSVHKVAGSDVATGNIGLAHLASNNVVTKQWGSCFSKRKQSRQIGANIFFEMYNHKGLFSILIIIFIKSNCLF